MSRLYVRFKVPKKYWLGSNLRLSPIMAARRSKWIIHHMAQYWLDAIKNQYNITPLTPSEADINSIIDKIMSKRHSKTIPDGFTPIIELAKLRLKQLETSLRQAEISNDNNTVEGLKLKIEAQKLTIKSLESECSITDFIKADATTVRQARIMAVKQANRNNRLFNQPVRFHVRIHNISKHLYDSPNAWPTIKPLQDAGTNTGILWEDDNNSCVNLTTFQGAEMLSKDEYVIDVIVETVDEPLVDNVFSDFEQHIK